MDNSPKTTPQSVADMKTILRRKGISVSASMSKEKLSLLCAASQNLGDDPDFQNCDTQEKLSQKLCSIGIICDPLSLKYSTTFDISSLPPFGLFDIFNYLLLSKADYNRHTHKAYKSFNDQRLFTDGHVRELGVHHHKDHKIFRAQVLPTCRTTTFMKKSTYTNWFILNDDGDVFAAYCECMGG